MSETGNAPMKEAPVHEELSKIYNTIDNLEVKIETLEKRLEFILAPLPKDIGDSTEKAGPSGSKMRISLTAIQLRLVLCADRIANVTCALDI